MTDPTKLWAQAAAAWRDAWFDRSKRGLADKAMRAFQRACEADPTNAPKPSEVQLGLPPQRPT